jgi:CO dehydrogenase maturation factor
MKIAVTGKGGAGKTTFAATLGQLIAEKHPALMVDADPSASLGLVMNFDMAQVTPLSALEEVIEELVVKAEAVLDDELAPQIEVAQLLTHIVSHPQNRNLHLLQMGTIPSGGSGCACAINAAVRSLLAHLVQEQQTDIIIDLVAGLEPFGRATVSGVDALLIMVEPGRASVQVAKDIHRLAQEIGIVDIYAVLNKIQDDEQRIMFQQMLSPLLVLGSFKYDVLVSTADISEMSPVDAGLPYVDVVRTIWDKLNGTNGVD